MKHRPAAVVLLLAASVAISAIACNDSDPPSSGSAGGDVADVGGDAPDDTADAGADLAEDPTPDLVEEVGDADADDADAEVDAGPEFPTVVVAVETRLSARRVRAGESVFVSCDAIDEDGEIVTFAEGVVQTWIVAPSDSLVPGEGADELIAARAGNASVSCVIPSLSLIDATPADLVIDPGPPYTILTEADTLTIMAGEQVNVSCTAYDRFGNYVPDADLDVLVDPFGEGVQVFDTRIIITRTGLFTLTCSADGAVELLGELIEVQPALPAALVVGVNPDRAIYTVGDVVSLTWTVTDAYGNLIHNPPVRFSSVPTVPSFGEGRFRFDREGIFRLTVFVAPPTATGEPLVGFVELIVNEQGPTVDCRYPVYGEMINAAPGSSLIFEGTSNDEFGVASVTVNGAPAFVRPDGSFAVSYTTHFGVNFVDVVAADSLGATSQRTCAFLVANQWIPEGAFFDDDIALTLTQDAFDDRVRTDGLDSLNDLVYSMLNSSAVQTQINAALNAANPIYPSTCVLDSWFGCIVRVGVEFRYFRMSGPNDSSLTLLDNGMQISTTVRGLEIGLRITGTFGTSGYFRLGHLGLTMTFDVRLNGGRPRVSIRRLDRVDVGSINSNFSGLTGFVIDILVDIFEGRIRDLIQAQIRGFIEGQINDVLDDVLSGLDIDSLGDVIEVPRLDGGDPILLGFGIRFSTINFTPARAFFGIGSRFTAPIGHGGFTFGAPWPPGAVIDDRPPTRAVKVALHLGMINQILHTLWRAGMFDADIGGGVLGEGLPSDISAELYSNLPPVAVGQDGGDLEIHFGGMRAQIGYPGLLPEPITVHMGVKITTGVDLVGDSELDFRDIAITDFYFDPLDAGLEASTQETLEIFLEEVVQYVLDSALNSALPNFPIPSFEIPPDLSAFGLPGGYLGILSPLLTIDSRHLVLQGNFGTR